jgi:hypothetical protein
MEKRYCRKDRNLVWVRNNFALAPGMGGAAPFFAVVEDITQRKEKESAGRYSSAVVNAARPDVESRSR